MGKPKKLLSKCFIERYQAGESPKILASQAEMSVAKFYKRLGELGLVGVRPNYNRVGARKPVDAKRIIQEYAEGYGSNTIANRIGCSRSMVLRVLRDANVTMRNASEQAYCSAKFATPEERLSRAKAAHAAIRGSKKKQDTLERAAKYRQDVGLQTIREFGWSCVFKEAGIITVPQFAIGRYNVDLAVPQAKIAIEIQNGWHNSDRHRARNVVRKAELIAQGWLVIELFDRHFRRTGHHEAVRIIRERMKQTVIPHLRTPN